MKKTALLFPGQGSQYIGMGKAFVEQSKEAGQLFVQAGSICNLDFEQLCFEGPLEELTRALNLQPALSLVDLTCLQYLKAQLPEFIPAYVAGHSLGEYPALHAAGVVSREDTIRLVAKRGELMEREGRKHPGGMRAVLGLTVDEVDGILQNYHGGVVVVANHNAEKQVVISGDMKGLDDISAKCQNQGGRVIPLKVSVANHSPLVAGAVNDFAAFMADISFTTPQVPILFNATAAPVSEPDEIRAVMARQIASRVRWYEIIQTMVAGGVELFVELGPKSVLTGLMKKILPRKSSIVYVQADTPELIDLVVGLIAKD